MLNSIQKRKDSGFTIVEVMIVLAIAGLVILIVFLAVPALQRNSRNAQRKSDVSSILGAVNEFRSNNAGQNPTLAQVTPLFESGFYDKTATSGNGSVSLVTATTAGVPALGANADNDRIVIVIKGKCGTGGAVVMGPPRSTAIQYLSETAGGTGFIASCQEG